MDEILRVVRVPPADEFATAIRSMESDVFRAWLNHWTHLVVPAGHDEEAWNQVLRREKDASLNERAGHLIGLLKSRATTDGAQRDVRGSVLDAMPGVVLAKKGTAVSQLLKPALHVATVVQIMDPYAYSPTQRDGLRSFVQQCAECGVRTLQIGGRFGEDICGNVAWQDLVRQLAAEFAPCPTRIEFHHPPKPRRWVAHDRYVAVHLGGNVRYLVTLGHGVQAYGKARSDDDYTVVGLVTRPRENAKRLWDQYRHPEPDIFIRPES